MNLVKMVSLRFSEWMTWNDQFNDVLINKLIKRIEVKTGFIDCIKSLKPVLSWVNNFSYVSSSGSELFLGFFQSIFLFTSIP